MAGRTESAGDSHAEPGVECDAAVEVGYMDRGVGEYHARESVRSDFKVGNPRGGPGEVKWWGFS